MIRTALFVLGSLFFLGISAKPLRNPGSHGFYRFFVFEAVLLLVLLNHPFWFIDPFSPLQLLSWLLLAGSLVLVAGALLELKKMGGYRERRDMPENFSFENTVHLVETGVYRYIRHPMYASLLLLSWGALCKRITPLTMLPALVASGFLLAAARVEERENLRFFGREYREYMGRTKRFIPWLF